MEKELDKNTFTKDTLFYMYDVQKTLFDAYKNPALFTEALKKVAGELTAEKICFLVLENEKICDIYLHGEFGDVANFNRKRIYSLLAKANGYILKGNSLQLYEEEIRLLGKPEQEEIARRNITNLMLAPVNDAGGKLVGVLAGFNMTKRWKDCFKLECICSDFLMASNNVKLYRKLELVNRTDAVTGLQNRKCFEESLTGLEKTMPEDLCCLYIDANGLHTLNNTLGHEAGDEMLRTVGNQLQELFAWEECYRIGGDEFVVICKGCSREKMKHNLEILDCDLDCRGYCVSAGYGFLSETKDIHDMVTLAEKRMYDAKQAYYQRAGHNGRIRVWNEKLEKMILEKRDADSFMEIISARFRGTYVVDLKTDRVRVIYEPDYFRDIMESNNRYFIPSMHEYNCVYVEETDQPKLEEFLNYDYIREKLKSSHRLKLRYRKKDGERLILHIYKAIGYGTENEDTLWMFETELTQ